MKARPFLAVVLAGTLLLLGLGVAGWWQVWQRSPLRLQHQALAVPRAARFVPRQAPLALFLFSDGEEPADYARAAAPAPRRRAAGEAIERLRDGAFAAAGLDYRSELASWLAPGIGLALIEPPEPGADVTAGGWVLALRSRDDQGARRFLQRFWQTRSLAGTGLQVSRYRGMGLISGRGALRGRLPVPLATALVDDDLVLIASGRGVLEQALDVSQIDELNLAADPRFAAALGRLGEGAALLVAGPAAFEPWLGLPLPASPEARPTQLIASLQPRGAGLVADALLDLGAGPLPGPPVGTAAAALPEGPIGDPASLSLIQNPAAWREVDLVRPLLARATAPRSEPGPLPALVAAADQGSLLVVDGPQGWLLGTPVDQPPPAAIETELAARGLVAAPLEVRDRRLTVWTRLQAMPARGGRGGAGASAGQLQASLAGWRTEIGERAWWGGSSLALLEESRAGRQGQRLARRLQALEPAGSAFQWAMEADPALALLRPWQPWRLLAALAGGGIEPAVEGLSVAVDPIEDGLRLRARLDFEHS
jgi:hypothetical protein